MQNLINKFVVLSKNKNAFIAVLILLLAALFILWSPLGRAQGQNIPDPKLTPGETRKITLKELCTPGVAKAYRNVTKAVKKKVYASYGIPGGNHTGYCAVKGGCVIDHLIAEEDGGTNGIKNLMPMRYSYGTCNAKHKDRLENKLHKLMCARVITIEQAQDEQRNDWRIGYTTYVDARGCE